MIGEPANRHPVVGPSLAKTYYLGDLMGVDLKKKPGQDAWMLKRFHSSSLIKTMIEPGTWRILGFEQGGSDQGRGPSEESAAAMGVALPKEPKPGAMIPFTLEPRPHRPAHTGGSRSGCDALEVPARFQIQGNRSPRPEPSRLPAAVQAVNDL